MRVGRKGDISPPNTALSLSCLLRGRVVFVAEQVNVLVYLLELEGAGRSQKAAVGSMLSCDLGQLWSP